MSERSRDLRAAVMGRNAAKRARVKAGAARFWLNQQVASSLVPAYRRVRSIDTPLAERYLFVIAHPRSGSTALSHVLQSHPDIVGFGEHHVSYDGLQDLDALATRNAFLARTPDTTHRYTLDKIVWNHHELADAVVDDAACHFVFLVREPIETLESYRRMFHDLPTDERRLESYRVRLDGMVSLAQRIADPTRMTMLTYDELVADTEATLRRLTDALDLEPPLRRDYELNHKSGQQSWGDPSPHLKAGTITAIEHAPTNISLDVIDAASLVYDAACRRLRCLTTGSLPAPADQPADGAAAR